MNKQSNLNLTIILFFSLILLLSVYAVLSQEDNLTDGNLVTVVDNNSLQENNNSLVGDIILNPEISPENTNTIQFENITNLFNETNQTNSSTNESSLAASEENASIPQEKIVVNEIQESDKVSEATKELLANSKDDDNKKFIIKYSSSFNKTQLKKFSEAKNIYEAGIEKIEGRIADLQEILDDDSVEYIEIDQDLNLLEDTTPWNVERVGATAVRNLSSGNGVKIAILDTGINEHNDLLIAGGWNIIDNSSDYTDNQGHGTAVAGILGAVINDEGLIGVSPDASIYAVKIMESESGQLSDAIAGVQWAIDNNMNIISMSFGFDGYSQIFKEVLQDAYNNDILLVGASGNDGIEGVVYPAAYDSVIAVGATDENNNRASFSNYGPELELMAPGVDINSTGLDDYYILGSGTSLAVPHVAGVAALIWARNRSLNNVEVRGKLQNDAMDLGASGKDDYYGYGLVMTNLTSENYNYSELAYYYEIYNISDYGLDNESYAYWLSGNGTIDNVNFSQGYYLINKNISGEIISQVINVTENGTIIPLIYITAYDNWLQEGSSDDALIWKNSYYIQMKVSTSTHDMEIWDYDHDSGSSMDECFFRDTATYNACYDDLCYGVSYSIGSSYIGGYHYIVQNSPITKDNALVWSYDSACSFSGSDSRDYYVIDQKKTVCSDSTHFMYYGRFGTGANDWEDYSDSFTCGIGSGCDSQQDEQTCTTQSCMPQSPCRRLENSSCNISNSDVTDDCYSGLNCTNNICKNMSGATTDLVITNIIPIQVVKGTDLVVGKTTLVRTYVLNNGTQSVNARVIVTIQTDLINTFQQHIIGPKNIPANTTIYFDTEFKPTKITSNGNITAEVEIYE